MWEYLVIRLDLDRQGELNRYGEQGWELVAILFESSDIKDGIYPTAYLKRRKSGIVKA